MIISFGLIAVAVIVFDYVGVVHTIGLAGLGIGAGFWHGRDRQSEFDATIREETKRVLSELIDLQECSDS